MCIFVLCRHYCSYSITWWEKYYFYSCKPWPKNLLKVICHPQGISLHIVHMFQWIISLPLNHSLQYMTVNSLSGLWGPIEEIGMCHYFQYNSHNIYDTGCPIWSCFLSAGPPKDRLPGASNTSLGHLLFSSGCNAIQCPTAEELQLRQNSLSPEKLIWFAAIIIYFHRRPFNLNLKLSVIQSVNNIQQLFC